MKKALADGILDFIATDHSPAPAEIKELESGNLSKAWGGIAGIQFLLSASWTALKEQMPLEDFIPLLTSQPARFLKIDSKKGKIEVGCDADLVVWHPESSYLVKKEEVFFRHKISPYIGQVLFGEVHQTMVAGETVFENKELTLPHQGTWLKAL